MKKYKYACPACHHVYDTRAEASSCSKDLTKTHKLKRGDFVSQGGRGIFKVTYVDNLLSLDAVREWWDLFGYSWRDVAFRRRAVPPFHCGKLMVNSDFIPEVRRQLALRKKQVAAGERLLLALKEVSKDV